MELNFEPENRRIPSSSSQGPTLSLFGSFPKLGVPFLGAPIIRTLVYWGLYWRPPIQGSKHF